MAEIRIKDIDEHEIDTILAEDIDFEGHLSFKKPLMIKGKFKGEIKATSALYIGEKAGVEAKVEANLISSKGKIKGDMVGHSRVELFSTAQVEGDITTPDFVVESGCRFNGYCNMGGGSAKKESGHHGQPVQQGTAAGAPQAPAGPSPQGSVQVPGSTAPGAAQGAQHQAAPAQVHQAGQNPQGGQTPQAQRPGNGPAQGGQNPQGGQSK
jgi:cytoskeletal protein CcmA (bactofilin family)